VTTPQEPDSRILPFRPRSPVRPMTATSRPEGVQGDRLLSSTPIPEPLTGNALACLRAVELGASSGAFYPQLLTEHVPAAAAALGISTIEVMLQTAGEYDAAFIQQVATNAHDAGVTVHSVHTLSRLHPFFDPYARRVEEARATFRQAIAAAVELGAQVLVWHGPNRPQVASDEAWERFIALAHDLAMECRAAGITLGIENVSYGALAQVRNVVALATRLEEIGPAEAVGFVFDPFQAAEAGANPFMMLAAMGNRVVNVHISDYREEDSTVRHLLPGDGDLPWSALIRAVASSGYRGPIMIEGPLGDDAAGIGRVRQVLDPLIGRVFSTVDEAEVLIALPAGVLEGIALFNQGQFHAQHEAIEAEWHAERGPIRRLYQGILQIGVGFHHALNGNQRGAVALLTDGIAKTADFLPEALGIDTAGLVRESERCLVEIRRLGPDRIDQFDPETIPTIVYAGA